MRYGMNRVLFDTGEGGEGGGGNNPQPTPTPENTPAPEPKKPDPNPEKKNGSDGVIPLSMHSEEVDRLKGALDKERTSNKEASKRLKETEKRLAELELKDKKATALSEAMSNLGADFEIPADKLPAVQELIGDLPDSDALSEKIAKLLDTAKAPKPKTRIQSPFHPGTPPAAQQSGKTREELWNLAKTNPEALKKALREQSNQG